MNDLKTVIFDFDGVIVDTERLCYECYKSIVNEYNYDMTLEEYVKTFAGRTGKENAENLSRIYSIADGNTVAEMYKKYETQIMAKGVDLKPGVKETLAYLHDHHIQVCLATSSLKQRALNILKEHHIDQYFDEYVCREDIAIGKPDPAVFLKALEKTNTNAENALVLEDSEFGIEASYAAKIPVICIVDLKVPDTRHEQMTYKVCHNMLEVLDLIKENK